MEFGGDKRDSETLMSSSSARSSLFILWLAGGELTWLSVKTVFSGFLVYFVNLCSCSRRDGEKSGAT